MGTFPSQIKLTHSFLNSSDGRSGHVFHCLALKCNVAAGTLLQYAKAFMTWCYTDGVAKSMSPQNLTLATVTLPGYRPSLLTVIYTPHAYMFKLISHYASKLIRIDV